MSLTKRQKIIAGSLTAISVIAAFAYVQLQKAIDYVMTYKYFTVDKISLKVVSFNLVFSLFNKSKFRYTIKEIVTDVYVGDQFVTKIANFADQVVEPKASTQLIVNVSLSPKDIAEKAKLKWEQMLLYPDKLKFTLDTKFKVAYGPLWFYIPHKEQYTLKQLKQAF